MKMAKVVAVRDLPSSTEANPVRNQTSRRGAIETLLRLYPETSETENAEIVQFLAKGPHHDVGLISGNEELAPKIAALKQEHRLHFRLKLWEVFAFLLVSLGPVAFLAYRYL